MTIGYVQGSLYVDEIAVADIAQKVGTPFYVYSAQHMREQFTALRNAFPLEWRNRLLICYAVKANSNQSIIKLFSNLGAGCDLVTGGELRRAISAGVPADKIVFSGIGKTDDDIRAALNYNIRQINIESIAELRKINTIAASLSKIAHVAFRLNPQLDAQIREDEGEAKITTGKPDSKFGIPWERVYDELQILQSSYPHIKLRGLSIHIGSNLRLEEFEQLRTAFRDLRQKVELLIENQYFSSLDTIDLGGGISVSYGAVKDPYIDPLGENTLFRKYTEVFNSVFNDFYFKHPNINFIIEPGRSLVANGGMLITKVINVKDETNNSKLPVTFLIVDAAMNDLLRPGLYNSYHEIRPVTQYDEDQPILQQVDICGPACETTDSFCRATAPAFDLASMDLYDAAKQSQYEKKLAGLVFGEQWPPNYSDGSNKSKWGYFLRRKFPPQKEGNLIAIMSAGAYGAVMASEYNTRPLVPEVLVDGDRWATIRERPTVEEIIGRDKVPNWIANPT